MRRIIGMALIAIAAAAIALAQGDTASTPEIDPGSATSALALLAGAALIIRGRRRN
jgi:MYXO-CTERM domain-containing protein